MTKEQLKSYLQSVSMVLTAIVAFLWGPLTVARPFVQGAANLCGVIASNDQILDILVSLFNAGKLSLPHANKLPSKAALASLTHASQHMESFHEAVATEANA